MNEQIVTVSGLNKKYGKKQVLKDVNFTCQGGQIIGLLGPNGSGKTTLIKILCGLITAYEGEVRICDQTISASSKALVSYLPDEAPFADWMKVKDVLKIYMDMYDDFDLERCLTILKRFQIDAKQRIKTMSKGTKEKFQLGMVMSRHAKLIVLDEPIGGVDPAAREVILDMILHHYQEDQTLIIATHLIADIERIFDSVMFLKEGEMIVNGNVEELRASSGMSMDELFKEKFRYA